MFENRLSIRDIYIGQIDASEAIRTGGVEAANDFYETFYLPAGLHLEHFLGGRKFFVYGLKGTGKTSFLRYVSEHVRRNPDLGAATDFFPFDRDFPQRIHEDVRAAYMADPNGPNAAALMRDADYEDIWTYILLKRISELGGTYPDAFGDHEQMQAFAAFMKAIKPSEARRHLFRWLPNIQRALVTLSDLPSACGEIEFDDADARTIQFHDYVGHALKLFEALRPGSVKVYMLVDEIEPRIASTVLFQTDCDLIRDLIVAIRRINVAQSSEDRSFYVLAAVRSEVLDQVKKLGKELQKLLEQFGYSMNWGDAGKADLDHPLIEMLCRKIAYAEKKQGIQTTAIGPSQPYIWSRYFRSTRKSSLDPKFLLDLTWFRPRDIVRMMAACQEIDGASPCFTESLIARARKRYSLGCWGEVSQQLTLGMDPDSLEGLTLTLTSFRREFTVVDLQDRINSLSNTNRSVQHLSAKHQVGDLAAMLYKNGVVGEIVGRRTRFVFRGDADLSQTGRLCVHRGLIDRFGLPHGDGSYSRDRRVDQLPLVNGRNQTRGQGEYFFGRDVDGSS